MRKDFDMLWRCAAWGAVSEEACNWYADNRPLRDPSSSVQKITVYYDNAFFQEW